MDDFYYRNGNTITYTYDNAGNRSSMTNTSKGWNYTTSYSYDKNNRLISIVENKNDAYYCKDNTYDKNGNQTKTESYRKNKNNDFMLDIRDIQNKKIDVEKFYYNGLDQLTGYENLSGRSNGKIGINAEYKYMANGYRLSKDVNGITTKFLWDGDNIIAELNSANAITAKYYWAIDLICDDSDEYYTVDAHGNVIEKYRRNDDYPGNWYFYNAFGGNDYFGDSDTATKWGYCGQYIDQESGLYYMRARYYDPKMGRFINEDPIKDGYNWYAYCGNNPVMFSDPSGLELRVSDYKKRILLL